MKIIKDFFLLKTENFRKVTTLYICSVVSDEVIYKLAPKRDAPSEEAEQKWLVLESLATKITILLTKNDEKFDEIKEKIESQR